MNAKNKNRITYLYRYFNAKDELLYVGISYNILVRSYNHERTAKWYPSISYVKIEKFRSRKIAINKEKIAIANENPLHNKMYSSVNNNRSYHNSNMKRTTLYLTDSQIKFLNKFSKKRDIPIAEIVRRVLDSWRDQ